MASTRTRILGTTRILEPVGKGGMAEVFRGNQESLQRQVAVKVMLPEIARDKELATRFRREALALAALQHENIVAIYDLVEKNRQIFMLMEYVEGLDVAELLKEAGPLPLDVALIIAAGVAGALEHAHFRRVIHRDIKPSNVMVSEQGQVKLTDFGIAKDLSIDDLTKTGFLVGTPAYLAPELFKGERPSPRTDIYSLGVLMYRCISGEKPFQAKTGPELYSKILSGERPKLRSVAPECSKSVERIVDRCLELDPDKRWRRTGELRREIESELRGLLTGSSAARLVAFLYEHGHADVDHLGALDVEDINYVDASIPITVAEFASEESTLTSTPTPSSSRPRWLLPLVLLVLAAAALGVTWSIAPDEVVDAWRWIEQTVGGSTPGAAAQ